MKIKVWLTLRMEWKFIIYRERYDRIETTVDKSSEIKTTEILLI